MSSTDKKLQGKVAIVTGGSRGIGASIVKTLAEQGAYVVINYTSSAMQAEDLVQEIESNGGKAVAVQANMASLDAAKKIVGAGINTFGKIDIIVNNAGVADNSPLGTV